jgi:hypothetical protein
MKSLSILLLLASLGLAFGASAEPETILTTDSPAAPVFLAGVDSGGAGAGVKLPEGDLYFRLRGSCGSVAGYCACVASGDNDCANTGCRFNGGQCLPY